MKLQGFELFGTAISMSTVDPVTPVSQVLLNLYFNSYNINIKLNEKDVLTKAQTNQ